MWNDGALKRFTHFKSIFASRKVYDEKLIRVEEKNEHACSFESKMLTSYTVDSRFLTQLRYRVTENDCAIRRVYH